MKRTKKFLLLIMIFQIFACNNNITKKNIKIDKLNFSSFSVEKINKVGYKDLGRFVKVVKLETTNNSVIGRINSISMDKNSNLLITDRRSSQKSFLFDKKGQFIRTFGKLGEGPGEYRRIYESAFFEDGNVIVAGLKKLMKFNKDGKLLKEIRISNLISDILVYKNKIYISIGRYRNEKEDNNAILIYDSNLNKVGGLNKYDKGLNKLMLSPKNIFCHVNDNVAFINPLSLQINIYNPKFHVMSIIKPPDNNNNTFYSILEKHKVVLGNNSQEVLNNLHSFYYIYAYNDNLLLLEQCNVKNIRNVWLMNLKYKKNHIYSMFKANKIIQDIFSSVIGSYDKGIIIDLSFNDQIAFEKYKKVMPELMNYEFNLDDNSFLAFFEINTQGSLSENQPQLKMK